MIKLNINSQKHGTVFRDFSSQEELNSYKEEVILTKHWGELAWTEIIPSTPSIVDSDGNIVEHGTPEQVIEHDATVEFTQEDVSDEYNKKALDKIFDNAQNFGSQLIKKFAVENIVMGITQDGMTGQVRKAMVEVVSALSTGSLYDAIEEIRAIPSNKKDVKYITDTRLLAAVNSIEDYLGLPKSTEL